MINGTAPYDGAQVYDIMLGIGKIVLVEPDQSFIVKFSDGSKKRFSTGGMSGTTRRIYWKNPIIVEPTHDEMSWTTFIKMSRILYELLSSVRK